MPFEGVYEYEKIRSERSVQLCFKNEPEQGSHISSGDEIARYVCVDAVDDDHVVVWDHENVMTSVSSC